MSEKLTYTGTNAIFSLDMLLREKIKKHTIPFIAFVTISIAWTPFCYADIYKYTDENGIIYFTNIPKDKRYRKVMSEGRKRAKANVKKNPVDPAQYQPLIYSKSFEFNVEPSLVNAIIKTESDWDSGAVSQKGAIGLMQLMPFTAEELNVSNPFNPEENIEGGIRYLRYLLNKFNEDITLALAAYNAGPAVIEKYGGVPPIRETLNYVKRVMAIYNGKGLNEPPTIIYKVIHKDGTVIYTNTPGLYKQYKLTNF